MRQRWIATSLILFAAVLYIPYLLRTIRYDEAYTLRHFAISPLIALFDWSAPNNHKLYSLLVWFTRLFIGNDLLALRLPAFFAALVSIALVFHLGKLQGGLIAAALLATNPVFADYAVNGRGYTLIIALTLTLVLAKHDRVLFWVAVALMLTLPSNVIILLARPKKVVILGLLTGSLFYLPALAWGQVGASLRFGATLPEMSQEFGMIFGGTGVFVLCGILLYGVWWGLLSWRSLFKRHLPVRYSTGGTIFISFRSFALLLAVGLLGIGTINLPLILNQLTELDRLQPVLDAQLQPSDSIQAGCCVDEPLRYRYPLAYDQSGRARQFVIPSTFGQFDLSACRALTPDIYVCFRDKIAVMRNEP